MWYLSLWRLAVAVCCGMYRSAVACVVQLLFSVCWLAVSFGCVGRLCRSAVLLAVAAFGCVVGCGSIWLCHWLCHLVAAFCCGMYRLAVALCSLAASFGLCHLAVSFGMCHLAVSFFCGVRWWH